MSKAVTVTHGEVLAAFLSLAQATASNALASVRLGKLVALLRAESAPVREAFREATMRAAQLDEAGVPKVQTNEAGEPLALLRSLTPAYVIDPTKEAALVEEERALMFETVTLTISPLTASDLARIDGVTNGEALLPFIDVD